MNSQILSIKRWASRRLALFVSMFLFVNVSPGEDDPGLLGHWPMVGAVGGMPGMKATGAVFDAEGPIGVKAPVARFHGSAKFESLAPVSVDLGKPFSISLWANVSDTHPIPGDLITVTDTDQRAAVSLGVASRTGVNHTQANLRQLTFGIDAGGPSSAWQDCGRPGESIYTTCLAVHAGQLFAGTCEPGKDQAGHVHRYKGGQTWEDLGSPDRSNAVTAMAVYNDSLYVGTGKYRTGGSALSDSENTNLGGNVFRWTGNSWEDCGHLPQTEAVGGMCCFAGKLYATSIYKPAGFFVFEGGKRWMPLPVPEEKRPEALCFFQDQLFCTCYDGGFVFRFDGKTWKPCGQLGDGKENTQTYGFAIYRGELYCGTWRSGRVYRYRGDNDWVDCGRLGEELEVMGMIVHNGRLFAGTLPLAKVYRYEGGQRWFDTGQLDQTPGVKYRRAWSMAAYKGQIFCGVLPSGRVYSHDVGRCVTYDHALKSGWCHLAAVCDGAGLRLYVDGELVAKREPQKDDIIAPAIQGNITIGAGPMHGLIGSLCHVRLYQRTLSPLEIANQAKRAE